MSGVILSVFCRLFYLYNFTSFSMYMCYVVPPLGIMKNVCIVYINVFLVCLLCQILSTSITVDCLIHPRSPKVNLTLTELHRPVNTMVNVASTNNLFIAFNNFDNCFLTSECKLLPVANPFESYDEMTFQECYQLSKSIVKCLTYKVNVKLHCL